jgi:nucleoside-diphosphate-sugar epimerase
MRLLVLGGTRFLGRHLVEVALERGHDVTLFNRGRSGLPPSGASSLRGDRDGGLDALNGGQWDAAIDTSGYVPRLVRASAERLAGSVGHYTFVSSISVYADSTRPHLSETASTGQLEADAAETVTGVTYGPLKALCEREAEGAMPGRTLVVRPGLIVGRWDTTDRFPYWVRRIARGGEVLAPGSPEAPLQIVDARDLAEWMLRMVERGCSGVFNATGPAAPLTLGGFLDTCLTTLGGDARLTWVDEAFLLEQKVEPFREMPLWVPAAAAGFMQCDIRRALDAGLTFRPLSDTIRATLDWDAPRSEEQRKPVQGELIGASMTADRERQLLQAWRVHARRSEAPLA